MVTKSLLILEHRRRVVAKRSFVCLSPAGQYLAGAGVSTFACSETQKFGHVTFFWNGNRSGFFDEDLETFVEVRDLLRFAAWLAPSCDTQEYAPPCSPPLSRFELLPPELDTLQGRRRALYQCR